MDAHQDIGKKDRHLSDQVPRMIFKIKQTDGETDRQTDAGQKEIRIDHLSFQLRLVKQTDVIAVERLPYEHANGLEVNLASLKDQILKIS